MDHEVDGRPMRGKRGESLVKPGHIGDIAGQDQIAAQFRRERPHPLLDRGVGKSEGQLCAMFAQRPGNTPGQRLVVRQAHDQPALSLHQAFHCASFRSCAGDLPAP